MGKEIERKFLINKEKWAAREKPEPTLYRQGYFFTKPGKSIRVRAAGDRAYLTIKSDAVSLTRSEFEYEIPQAEANEILDKLCDAELHKMRYVLLVKNKKWEIDEFLEENAGLLMAEIELENEKEKVELPDWIESEVTGELKYYNANLVINPYNRWVY